ncbi:MAG: B12-binding domain-containing radical SAM protein [Candidatus Omnitrophica bacterium]|nr:B12-binding domain-containing radical SAM protein [Candidatus Omnitrophota bacterium]
MRILFVMPKIGAWATHGIHRSPNQLYAHWASYVREHGYSDVSVIDGRALEIPMDELVERVKEKNPDVVVMGEQIHGYAGYAVLRYFKEASQRIKKELPKTKIILGGLWYSAMPVMTLEENPAVDFVVMAEEDAFLDLIEAIDKKKNLKDVAGVTSRLDNGEIVMGPYRPLLEDLDKLPLPAYDLFPMDKYVGHTHWKPFVDMITSRGCPSACTFCYEWDQFDPRSPSDFLKWRAKSAQRVIEELELLHKKYGIKVVVIQDDNFNVDPQRVKRFCELKLEKNNPIKWVSLGRAVDWVNSEEILPLMKQTGLFMGVFGIEVTTPEELKRIAKGTTIEQIKKTIEILRKNDIAVVADIMIGFDYDTEAIIKQRFEFADFVDPDVLWIGYVTPAPNSPMWRIALKKKWIDPKKVDFSTWDFLHPVIPTEHLSIEDLGRLGAWCMREFYSKPGRINRIMESNFDILAKLCFQDVMAGVGKWEAGATKGEAYI